MKAYPLSAPRPLRARRAAIRIEGSGADAIGDRSAIEARLP